MQIELNREIPNVLAYTSVLKYLADYFDYRKNLNSSFSYEDWSLEMGFRSRAFLKMICSGQRNITDKFIQVFAQKMKFSEKEKIHFLLLARIHYTKSEKLKDLYKDSMLKTLNLDQTRQDLDDQFFLASLYNPVVQMLVTFRDFKATEENLLNILPISQSELIEVLNSLEDLDLIFFQDGVWKSKIDSFRIKDIHSSAFMRKFHENTLNEAIQKLQTANEMRKNRSIFFSVKKEEAQNLSVDIEDFLRTIRNKYGSECLHNQCIVKLNLQLYNLTQTYVSPEKTKDQN